MTDLVAHPTAGPQSAPAPAALPDMSVFARSLTQHLRHFPDGTRAAVPPRTDVAQRRARGVAGALPK